MRSLKRLFEDTTHLRRIEKLDPSDDIEENLSNLEELVKIGTELSDVEPGVDVDVKSTQDINMQFEDIMRVFDQMFMILTKMRYVKRTANG